MGNRTVRNVQTERAGKQIPKAVQSPKRRGASGPVFESFLTVTFRKSGSERENVNEIALFILGVLPPEVSQRPCERQGRHLLSMGFEGL